MFIRLRYDRLQTVCVCKTDYSFHKCLAKTSTPLRTNVIAISINLTRFFSRTGPVFVKNVDLRSVYVPQNLNKYRMFVVIFQQENPCHSLIIEWLCSSGFSQFSHLQTFLHVCHTVWEKWSVLQL